MRCIVTLHTVQFNFLAAWTVKITRRLNQSISLIRPSAECEMSAVLLEKCTCGRCVLTRSRVGTTRFSNAAASDADGSTVDRRRLLPCPASDGIASSGVCHCRAISVQALPDPRNTASVSRTIRLLRRLAPSEPSSSGSGTSRRFIEPLTIASADAPLVQRQWIRAQDLGTGMASVPC